MGWHRDELPTLEEAMQMLAPPAELGRHPAAIPKVCQRSRLLLRLMPASLIYGDHCERHTAGCVK